MAISTASLSNCGPVSEEAISRLHDEDFSIAKFLLSGVLFFFHFQDNKSIIFRMKLGFCPNVESFFAEIARHAQILEQSILQIAVRLPDDICRPEKRMMLIEAGEQGAGAFHMLIGTVWNAIAESEPAGQTRCIIITGTIAVK
jgi:hypothetical protein